LKTIHHYSYNSIVKISVFILLIFSCFNAKAQVEPTEPVQDTIGYNKGKIAIKNPPTVVEAYTYDPITDRYIYTNTVGGFNVNYPVILTPQEYKDLVVKESVRNYFKKKNDVIEGKKEGTAEQKRIYYPVIM